jgi:hypothetical protein
MNTKMEDITVKLTKFYLNYHPSGVKMLAKFTQPQIGIDSRFQGKKEKHGLKIWKTT